MIKSFLIITALAAVPAAALAQPNPNCVASNQQSRAEGTILGGIGGALIGGALGRGAGAVVGGVTGAVAGNAIAGSRNDPCPSGYVYAPPPGYQGYGPPPPPPPQAANFWTSAPGDIRQRIDWLRDRVDRAASRGMISPDQAQRAYGELRNLGRTAGDLARRDGELTDADRDYLQSRLNYLGSQLHWMERTNAQG